MKGKRDDEIVVDERLMGYTHGGYRARHRKENDSAMTRGRLDAEAIYRALLDLKRRNGGNGLGLG